jgi:hypothetical protein
VTRPVVAALGDPSRVTFDCLVVSVLVGFTGIGRVSVVDVSNVVVVVLS